MIQVYNPYNMESDGCPKEMWAPCLAEGGVHILVDGEASGATKNPGNIVHLPAGVVVSAVNLLPECRPFGGNRIRAPQFGQGRRPSIVAPNHCIINHQRDDSQRWNHCGADNVSQTCGSRRAYRVFLGLISVIIDSEGANN